jgi:hypothetical protein
MNLQFSNSFGQSNQQPPFAPQAGIVKKMGLGMRLLAVFFGLAFLVPGVFLGLRTLDLQRNGVKTMGTVVDVRRELSQSAHGSSSYHYVSVIEFTTPDNQSHRFDGTVVTSRPETIGTKVNVVYDPKNPENAQSNSVAVGFLIDAAFILVGLFIVVAGLFAKAVRIGPSMVGGPSMSGPFAAGSPVLPGLTSIVPGALPPVPTPVPPELSAYIAAARAQGLATGDIRQNLVTSGWNPADVDRALNG